MEPIILLPEGQPTLTISRRFAAPRELVWRMFSDPFHLSQWWGPAGFTNRIEEFDFRTGGCWHHVMIGPDGREYPARSTFIEIVAPERIVYRNAELKDEPAFAGNPPPGFKRTLCFAEENGVTTLTFFGEFDTMDERDRATRRGFVAGTLESYAKLAEHLEAIA